MGGQIKKRPQMEPPEIQLAAKAAQLAENLPNVAIKKVTHFGKPPKVFASRRQNAL